MDKRLYLKTDLENYYEKFGAKYIENLSNGEKLYCIDIQEIVTIKKANIGKYKIYLCLLCIILNQLISST